MRVLYVNPLSELGGSERSLLDALSSFQHSVPEVERRLLVFAEGALATRAGALGIPVEIEPIPASLAGIGESREGGARGARSLALAEAALGASRFLWRLRARIRRARPDIVHTNGMKAHVLAAVAAPEVPRVVHLRDFASARPFSRHLLPWLGRRSIVVANSRAVAADALSIAPSLTVRTVYNGIDLSEFRCGPRDGSYLARLAGLEPPSEETLGIGLIATYAWWKGHRRFLESAAEVLAMHPRRALRFYVVGGPIYRTGGSEVTEAALRELVRSHHGLEGHVGFVPFQQDAGAVHRSLDIVVHASERPEPFGRTIVEAMASGRAVVAARAGGAAELVRHRETAMAYEPNAPGALARAVLELVNDAALRERLGRAARLEAEARFDRARLGPELFGIYQELLGVQPVPR
jgi:glycosyltransferase involved in cell wall biosynthesis